MDAERHAPHGGFKLWYALLGSIAAWLIHLCFGAGFVQYTCNVPGTTWIQHVATAVCAAATVLAMVWSARLVREGGGADEESGTTWGRTRFLGVMGLLIGAIDLLLILGEGSVVVFVHRACGA